MPRPGTDIQIVDAAVPAGAVLDTGQAFMAGAAERGSTSGVLNVQGIKDYENKYGGRSGGSLLYDSVNAYFAEGGGTLYVSRVDGPASAVAGGAFGSLDVDAASPGTWGNGVTVAAEDPPYTSAPEARTIVVSEGGVVKERSPIVTTATQLVSWAAQHSSRVVFTKGADDALPAVAVSVNLTGGVTDATWSDTAVADALAYFDYALGPGQTSVPGHTDEATHRALLDHVQNKRRVALLDLLDTDDFTELVAAVQAIQDHEGMRFALALGSWVTYPGPAGSEVTIPYSGVQSGLIAASDAAGDPNRPAAGVNGISRYALGLANDFTDDDREVLNEAGVAMAKVRYGQIRTYGYRTGAGPLDTNWLWFGNSRLIMSLAHECDAIAESYVFRQIDGRRGVFAALNSDLKGVLLPHYNAGALFGETPQEAFQVDTGLTVNPVDTIKNGEIHAVVRVKCSPSAEWVQIEIVKTPIETSLGPVAAAA
jgi:uncharacterized protein